MSFSTQECLHGALKCHGLALQTKDANAKAALLECARQWLELARRGEDLERERDQANPT